MSVARESGTSLSTEDAFLADPRGRHVVGPTFAYFCIDASLFGFAMWGAPSPADVTRMRRLLVRELEPDIPRHHSLAHFGGVQRVDAAAFDVMKAHLDENAERLAAQIEGQGVVYGAGMSAMVIAGALRVSPPSYPARAFASTREAIAWMCPARPELVERIEVFAALGSNASPLVAQLRAFIEVDLHAATLARAAAGLGCTSRTLQRRLREADTSFQNEYAHVQLAKAKQWLAETDLKVSAVGREVGFTSASHFGKYFRQRTGLSPRAWRLQR